MTISLPPTAPSRQDPATFSDRADAFASWLVGAVPQFNALAVGSIDAGNFQSITVAGQITGTAVTQSPTDTTAGRLILTQHGFTRGNLIGTVSQSGGVPTGAVIERGSNSNGKFVRFADGTQIMWININVGDVTKNGSGTFADPYHSDVVDWNFPAAQVLHADDMSFSVQSTAPTNVPARMWAFGIGRLQSSSVTSLGVVRIGDDVDDRDWQVVAAVHTRWF